PTRFPMPSPLSRAFTRGEMRRFGTPPLPDRTLIARKHRCQPARAGRAALGREHGRAADVLVFEPAAPVLDEPCTGALRPHARVRNGRIRSFSHHASFVTRGGR